MGVLRIGQRALCYGFPMGTLALLPTVSLLAELPSCLTRLFSSLTNLVRAGSNAGRDLRDALDALPGLGSLRRGREAARRRIGRHGSTHDGPQ